MNLQNLRELEEQGYTIVKNVLTENEVRTSIEHFWDWLEDLGSGIDRHDLETWSDENWPGNIYTGFVGNHGISQSQFVWFLRAHPKVKDAFVKIWNSHKKDLSKGMISSMDSVICWRPWWFCDFEDWEPKTEGLHVDQNPIEKEGFRCVQGMITLYDVTETSGGLQVVPRTHTIQMQESLKAWANPLLPPYNQGDFILLSDTPKNVSNNICTKKLLLEAKLIKAKAGDLILWDSRLIHTGKVGLGKPIVGSTPGKAYDLLRLAVPICLMPRNGVSEEVLEERREAYMKRYTMNHWANEIVYCICNDTHAINITKEPSIHNLSKEEKELL